MAIGGSLRSSLHHAPSCSPSNLIFNELTAYQIEYIVALPGTDLKVKPELHLPGTRPYSLLLLISAVMDCSAPFPRHGEFDEENDIDACRTSAHDRNRGSSNGKFVVRYQG